MLKRHNHHKKRRLICSVTLGAALVFGSFTLPATQEVDSNAQRLKDLQAQIEASQKRKKIALIAARSAESDSERTRQQMIALTAEIRSGEALSETLEDKVDTLEKDVEIKTHVLDGRRQDIAELLGALERLAARPAALSFLQPGEAIKTARSASLLSSLIPEVEKKIALIKLDLADLATAEASLIEERSKHGDQLAAMEVQRIELKNIVKARQAEAKKARGNVSEETKRVAKMVREARSLEELIAKLNAEAARAASAQAVDRGAIPLNGRFVKARGKLPQPVSGKISERFGKKLLVGTLKGIRIKARSKAQVIAPFDGQVVFAGPFRHYGQLIIIRHGDGYHSLLAGIDNIYVTTGQWLLGGEPVGIMSPSASPLPELYLELRRKGRPFNPKSWLTTG